MLSMNLVPRAANLDFSDLLLVNLIDVAFVTGPDWNELTSGLVDGGRVEELACSLRFFSGLSFLSFFSFFSLLSFLKNPMLKVLDVLLEGRRLASSHDRGETGWHYI